MGNLRAVILDFDGVLVESNAEKTEAFKELFSMYPLYETQMLDYHIKRFSTSRMDKFSHFVHEIMDQPGDTELVKKMADQFSAFVMNRVLSCPEVPGAMEFLIEFSEYLPLYISSATPQDELREIVHRRNMAPYLTDIFGDPPIKKHDAIRSVLEKENALPTDVLFIGDALSDYLVTRESGIRFMGRDSGLSFEGHDIRLCKDLFEIADVIRKEAGGEP